MNLIKRVGKIILMVLFVTLISSMLLKVQVNAAEGTRCPGCGEISNRIKQSDLSLCEIPNQDIYECDCNETWIITKEPTNHEWVKNGQGYKCTICEEKVSVSVNGNAQSGIAGNVPTTCSKCGEVATAEIVLNATCTEEGITRWTCECGNSWERTWGPYGHTWLDYKCVSCEIAVTFANKYPEQEAPNPKATKCPKCEMYRMPESSSKNPTCDDLGVYNYTCDCGETWVMTKEPTNHKWEKSEQGYKCTICEEKVSVSVNSNTQTGIAGNVPTRCSKCGEITTAEIVLNATCTEEGITRWTCECGNSWEKTWGPYGHIWVDYVCESCNLKLGYQELDKYPESSYPGGNNTDVPSIDKPDTDNPNTDKPDTDNPNTDKPDTDNPNTDKPDTDKTNTNISGGNMQSGNNKVDNTVAKQELPHAGSSTLIGLILALIVSGLVTYINIRKLNFKI